MKDFLIILSLFILTILLVAFIAENHEGIREWNWEREARKHPDKYSNCIVCGTMKPHKIMMMYKGDMYCDACLWEKSGCDM